MLTVNAYIVSDSSLTNDFRVSLELSHRDLFHGKLDFSQHFSPVRETFNSCDWLQAIRRDRNCQQQHRLCKTFRSNILIGIKFFVPHTVCTINKKKYTGSVDFTGFSVFCTNYCRADTNRRSMRSYICTVRSQEKKCLNSLTWNGVVGWSFKVHPLLIEKWKYVICEISTVVWIDSCGVVQSCLWMHVIYILPPTDVFSLSVCL